jgi:hypothetical protein
VDEEMDDGGFPTPEWVRETINSGSLTSLNTGRLARKLTAMIKLSARTDEETEETEAVILEFVDKVMLALRSYLCSKTRSWQTVLPRRLLRSNTVKLAVYAFCLFLSDPPHISRPN